MWWDAVPWGTLTGPAALAICAALVITGRLVPKAQLDKVETQHAAALEKAEARADKWQDIAMEALGVASRSTTSAEVVADAFRRLPDPGAEASS